MPQALLRLPAYLPDSGSPGIPEVEGDAFKARYSHSMCEMRLYHPLAASARKQQRQDIHPRTEAPAAAIRYF